MLLWDYIKIIISGHTLHLPSGSRRSLKFIRDLISLASMNRYFRICDSFELSILPKVSVKKKLSAQPNCVVQWFTTKVPRYTTVPQWGVRGAAKFGITAFILMFYYLECHKLSLLIQQGRRQIFFNLKGAVNRKRLKNIGVVYI